MTSADRISELTQIAVAARQALETYSRGTHDVLWTGFPRGACGAASELLGRYLLEAGFAKVKYMCGEKPEAGTHAWVEVDGLVLDITGDQFGEPPVVVKQNSQWHAGWEWDANREICFPSGWPSYPQGAWNAMKQAIDKELAL